jgi:hypothetical protein
MRAGFVNFVDNRPPRSRLGEPCRRGADPAARVRDRG